jgi:hypothetical protein
MNEVGIYNFSSPYIIQYYSWLRSNVVPLAPPVGVKITFWNSFLSQTTYITEKPSKSGFAPN